VRNAFFRVEGVIERDDCLDTIAAILAENAIGSGGEEPRWRSSYAEGVMQVVTWIGATVSYGGRRKRIEMEWNRVCVMRVVVKRLGGAC